MIVFINGSINSGKSTVAKLIAEKLSNTALVEIDSLRDMIEWVPIDEAVPINLENAISVIKNFVKKGLNVVVPYPLSQEDYDYMMENLKDLQVGISAFTLAPKMETALSNRGRREISEHEKERIKHHYKIGIPNPTFGEVIDNSEQTPQETAKYILSRIDRQKYGN